MLILKDWRKASPRFTYTLYGLLATFALLSGALIPLIMNLTS
jgi:hypothetical protein